MITVTRLDELKRAKKNGNQEIVVQGELANKLKTASRLAKLGKFGIAALVGVVGFSAITAPVTGGFSMLTATTIATLTGLEITAIITASTLGIALILAIFKDYEEISFSEGKMVLKKKQK